MPYHYHLLIAIRSGNRVRWEWEGEMKNFDASTKRKTIITGFCVHADDQFDEQEADLVL